MRLFKENPNNNGKREWQQWSTEAYTLPLLPFSKRRKYRLLYIGSFITGSLFLILIFAPQISSNPNHIDLSNRFASPSLVHFFGTDHFGRDLWSRMVYGTRISLQISLLSVALALLIGVPTGLITGYIAGKWVDEVIMRLIDSMLAIPSIVLALLLRLVLGSSVLGLILTIAIAYMPVFAREVRSLTLLEKEKYYIEALHAIGQTNQKIIFNHILPNITPPIIILATTFVANAIIIEASFSFLGMGVSIFEPSWGTILSDSKPFMQDHSHLIIFPVSLIFLSIFGINALSEGLRIK